MRAIQYNTELAAIFPADPAIVVKTKNVRFNQIVRLAVCLAGNPFATQEEMVSKTAWDARLAATDATRIILSPLFSNTKITPSKPLQTGADSNATYRGNPIYFGEGTAMFSGEFQDCDAEVIDTFFSVVSPYTMSNGVGSNPAVAFWINNDGHIASTATWDGLPCINLAPRSVGSDGLNSSNKVPFDFYLPPNWDGGITAPVMSNVIALSGDVDLRTYP